MQDGYFCGLVTRRAVHVLFYKFGRQTFNDVIQYSLMAVFRFSMYLMSIAFSIDWCEMMDPFRSTHNHQHSDMFDQK